MKSKSKKLKGRASRPAFTSFWVIPQTSAFLFRSVVKELGWRVIPILVALLAIALFLYFIASAPMITPFVYTLF